MHRLDSALLLAALPLLLATPAAATGVDSTARCSKMALPMRPPSVFFIGRASGDMREVPVLGAGERLEADFNGTVPAQPFDVEQVAGTDAAQLPRGTRQLLVVPWGYSADCSPQKWPSSRVWVETGVTGLVYGQLRAREHWVDGVPTIDMHNPYHLPYPRRSSEIAVEDAFRLLSLLPVDADADSAALLPLAEWIRERPELAEQEPGRFLAGALSMMTYTRIRALEPEIAGTYRFTLEASNGRSWVFYARTESNPVTPHGVETGTAHVDQLRPPRADGYVLLANVAASEDALPASRQTGRSGYLYGTIEHERRPDGTRVWQGGAELSLLNRAFPADAEVQQIIRLQPDEQRSFIRDNLPPGGDATWTMSPGGRVTFLQRFRLPGGRTAVLRGERVSTVVMPAPRY